LFVMHLGPMLRDFEGVSSLQRLTVDDDDPDAPPDGGVRKVVVELAVENRLALLHACEGLRNRAEVQSVFVREGTKPSLTRGRNGSD
jgi:hypothetical protein